MGHLMRCTQLILLLGPFLSLALVIGCGSDSSKPADPDDITSYLEQHPDQVQDAEDEADMEEEGE